MSDSGIGATARDTLLRRIEEALARIEPLRTTGSRIWVREREGGQVEFEGHVSSRVIKRMILEAVRNIEGVNGIVDHIQTDPDLEIAVARALATDPKTRGISPGAINIRSHLGAVSLTGFLPVGFDRGEVRRVVHEVPGVRVAEDRLQD